MNEYNDYDQHGEYFVAAFVNKPTKEQLNSYGVEDSSVEHVLKGGGRIDCEYSWYVLREYELQ